MGDFISDLKKDILTAIPDVQELWAELCAIAPLATILHNAHIVEKIAPMKLNLIMLAIGPPGISKSLPMMNWALPIIERTGRRIERDLLLPSRSSVPGFIKYVNEGNEEGQIPRNVGILIRDEFSGMFKELRKADWQSDGMEFISEMYDGTFQKRATIKDGVIEINNLYASMITATTPYFVNKLDNEFYIQGTGNRILYSFYDIEQWNPEEIDPIDFFSKNWQYRNKKFDEYAYKLQQLHEKEVRQIYVDSEPGTLWAEYKLKCDQEWKEKHKKDPLGWEHHPIKRYAEFALKLAGIYATSENVDKITNFISEERWEKQEHCIPLNINHMQRAIELVEKNRENFKQMVILKNKNIPRVKPTSLEDKAKSMLIPLTNAKVGILTSSQWRKKQDITASPNEFTQLKDICVNKGWAIQIDEKDVPNDIKEGLGNIYPATKIFKFIEH